MKLNKTALLLILASVLILASSIRNHKKKSQSHLELTTGWTLSTGAAIDLAYGAQGALTVVGTDNNVYSAESTWYGTMWLKIGGGGNALRVAVDPNGLPWYVNNQGNIFRRLSNSNFQQVSGCAKDIGIGSEGSVWIIGCDAVPGGYSISKYNPGSSTGWNKIDGGAVRISVDPNGLPWVVGNDGTIFQRTAAGSWPVIPGCAKDIGIGITGAVAVVGCNAVGGGYAMYMFNFSQGSWYGLSQVPNGAMDVTMDTSGIPWVSTSIDEIYNYYSY